MIKTVILIIIILSMQLLCVALFVFVFGALQCSRAILCINLSIMDKNRKLLSLNLITGYRSRRMFYCTH